MAHEITKDRFKNNLRQMYLIHKWDPNWYNKGVTRHTP